MPPKKVFFKYKEEDVYKALDEIQAGCKIRETCRKYNIPHSTIINKIKMRYPVQRKMGPPTILTPEEEQLLCRWINAMAKKGIPIKKEQLVETVTKIITTDRLSQKVVNSSDHTELPIDEPNERNLDSVNQCTALVEEDNMRNLPICSTNTDSNHLQVVSSAIEGTGQQLLQTATSQNSSLLQNIEKDQEEILSPLPNKQNGSEQNEGHENSTNIPELPHLNSPSLVTKECLNEVNNNQIIAPESPQTKVDSNSALISQPTITLLPELSQQEQTSSPNLPDFDAESSNIHRRESTPTTFNTVPTYHSPEPGPSREPNDQERTPVKPAELSKESDIKKPTWSAQIPISPSFASALVWPTESPLKKDGKRKFTKKRLPDAVTSVQWMKYWNEKKKEQEEKESKKLAREEKKKLQELNKSEKPKAKRIKKRAEEAIESDPDEDDVPLASYRKKTRSEDDKIELGSYVIVKYEGEYFPGIVKNIDKQGKEVSTMVLSGPNTTFKWPDKEDKIWYANDKIVEKINAPVSINNRGSFKVVEMAKYFNWI